MGVTNTLPTQYLITNNTLFNVMGIVYIKDINGLKECCDPQMKSYCQHCGLQNGL